MTAETRITISLRFMHNGEMCRFKRTMPIEDTLLDAKLRVQQMIDRRYDGLCQKPEILNDLEQMLVQCDNVPDVDKLFDEVTAAAMDTTLVAH